MVDRCGNCREFSDGGNFTGICEQLGRLKYYDSRPELGNCNPKGRSIWG